jgi:Rieske Fe-S protein
VQLTPLDTVPPGKGPAGFDRRTFLDALLAVGFVSTAAAVAYPVSSFLIPPATGEPVTNAVVAGKAVALKPNTGMIFPFGSKPAIVIRTLDGELHAFNAVCTHLECTVQFKADIADLVRVSQQGVATWLEMWCPARRPATWNGLPSTCAASPATRRSSCHTGVGGSARMQVVQQVVDWLDERIDLSGLKHFVAKKGVPVHAQEVWCYLGGLTLFLFIVQVFTGILLLLYYRPSASEAYESVQFIVTTVPFGWLIRNIHSWSANLLVLAAFGHFFSVFFLKSCGSRASSPGFQGFSCCF